MSDFQTENETPEEDIYVGAYSAGDYPNYFGEESEFGEDIEPVKPKPREPEVKLDWLVQDFEGITDSVYEGIMIAAHRARQIGRRQKQEIDAFNATIETTEITNSEEEESDQPGVDHFHHVKPTILALNELKKGEINYHYQEKTKK